MRVFFSREAPEAPKVCVKIEGKRDYICLSNENVGDAINRIRNLYSLPKGEILLNNRRMLSPLKIFGAQQLGSDGVLSFETQTQLIPLFSLQVPKFFKRYQFTTAPVFGDELIVGNLKSIVRTVQDEILWRMEDAREVKEAFPFHCVINPPRHGKSLLLDRLFLNDDSVVVIGVTYNSTTGLVRGETNDPDTAIKWFWIRVLKSMLEIPGALKDLDHLIPHPETCSWPQIRDTIIQGLTANPFIDNEGNEKNILFCIDEFSLLTDHLSRHWQSADQLRFISQLHQIKRACYPFIQFVMTGFHSDMKSLLASSSATQHTLQLCDLSSSRPLLQRIKEEYTRSDEYEEEVIPFPLALFEVVKSTPGLLGAWAEMIHRQRLYCQSIYDFSFQFPWFNNLTKTKEVLGGLSPLKSNWLLIFRSLLSVVEGPGMGDPSLVDAIINAEIGTFTAGTLEIIPLCFVVIVAIAHNKKIGEGPCQEIILRELAELFRIMNHMNPKQKDGNAFELLTYTALHLRLLLWAQLQESESAENIRIRFQSFLPCDASWSGTHPQLRLPLSVHLIRTKESLRKLLTPPLYNLFPLGIQSLDKDWETDSSPSLVDLINSKTHEYQLLPQHDNGNGDDGNPLINLSTLVAEKDEERQMRKQAVVCRLKDKTLQMEFVLELFESMTTRLSMLSLPSPSSSLSPSRASAAHENEDQNHRGREGRELESILQSFDKKQLSWWERLKTLTKQLMASIEANHSLIPTASGADGADLLMIWKVVTVTEEDLKETVIHLAVLELKDQRQTPLSEWEKRWDSLMSPMCILFWMPLFYPQCRFAFHFIFAGRERVRE